MGGRKQWVKQQDQRYQDYVHVAETLEVLVVAMMVNSDLESCVQHAIKQTLKIKRTIVKDVVL
jgi:hypothetical protein